MTMQLRVSRKLICETGTVEIEALQEHKDAPTFRLTLQDLTGPYACKTIQLNYEELGALSTQLYKIVRGD